MNHQVPSGLQVIILTAGKARRLWPLTLSTPKALLSVGGRPALFHMLLPLMRMGIRVFTIVCSPSQRDQISQVVEGTLSFARITVRYVVQEHPHGPGHALALCRDHITGPTLVILGDTLCDLPQTFTEDWIGVSEIEQGTHSRWCMVGVDGAGRVTHLYDKPVEPPPSNLAAVGIYYFASGSALQSAIDEAVASGEKIEGEFQLSTVLSRYMKERTVKALPVANWRDFGTLEGYTSLVRRSLPSRYFNHVFVTADGTLVKHSTDESIVDEMQWYQKIPEESLLFAPRFLGADPHRLGYRTEFLAYPTLAELFTFGQMSREGWQFAFSRLLALMNSAFWSRFIELPDIQARARYMYVEKTLERIRQWDRQDLLQAKTITINGRRFPGFQALWKDLAGSIDQLVTSSRKYSTLIHGDLTFGNILFSPSAGIFRLVDPRGSFGGSGAAGDCRYDLAKLRQCYHGRYDVIMADLFQVDEESGPDPSFTFQLYPSHLVDPDLFDHNLEELGFDLAEVELIEALLFLSMIPLHADAPHRQNAFFLTAIELMARCAVKASSVSTH